MLVPVLRGLLCLLPALMVGEALADPDGLPPPAARVRLLPDGSGDASGLLPGATTAYALGRSLLQQGETEAALVYLSHAHRLAPASWLVKETFARGLGEAGYTLDAVRLYGELVAAAPDSLSQRRQYALLLAQSGRTQAALEQVEALLARGARDPDLVKLQADLLGRLDRIDAALAVYREAAARDRARAEDYFLAGGALLERHQRFAAMADFLREGIAELPASRGLVLPLLRYLVHGGQFAAARQEAAAADARRLAAGLTRQPDCSLDLADVYLRRGNLAQARELLVDLAAREADDPRPGVQTLLARIHLAAGDVAEALPILTAACERWSQDAELRFLLGRALELQGDLAAAAEQLQLAIDLQPELVGYRIALLRIFALLQRQPHDSPASVEGAFRRADLQEHAEWASAHIDPQDHGGHLILGYSFRRLGDLPASCRHFRQAGEADETRVIAHLELSLCLQESGAEREAINILSELHGEYPDDPEVANNLAYMLAEQGEDLLRAEELVRQALRNDPQNGAYLDSLGWVLYRRGDFAGAFEWLVEAANQRPEDPTILEHLGLTLHRLGRAREALDVLRRALVCGGDAERLHALIAEVERDP